MLATLGLAAIRGAQFGIGAACATLACSPNRNARIAQLAAFVGVVVGVAAIAFTLISETFGPVIGTGTLGTVVRFAAKVFVATAIVYTVYIVAVLILLHALIEQLKLY